MKSRKSLPLVLLLAVMLITSFMLSSCFEGDDDNNDNNSNVTDGDTTETDGDTSETDGDIDNTQAKTCPFFASDSCLSDLVADCNGLAPTDQCTINVETSGDEVSGVTITWDSGLKEEVSCTGGDDDNTPEVCTIKFFANNQECASFTVQDNDDTSTITSGNKTWTIQDNTDGSSDITCPDGSTEHYSAEELVGCKSMEDAVHTCSFECTTDDDCPFSSMGQTCSNGICINGPQVCESDTDCSSNEHCIEGFCVGQPQQSCQSDADCEEDMHCIDGTCALMSCISDNDCPEHFVCEEGTCKEELVYSCNTDADCDEGEYCSVDFHICIPYGTECTTDNDCEEGLICDHGDCVSPQCESDADCDNGKICVAGYCMESQRCTSNDDCPTGYKCSENAQICIPDETTTGCTSHEECGDKVCYNGECVNLGGSCTDDSDCVPGSVCAYGLCMTKACSSDSDCPAESSCLAGNCFPNP